MPLLDHFHRPHSEGLPWESVNTLWVAAVVAALNRTLPRDRFRAFANRHLGPQVEADVAEFDRIEPAHQGNGAVATLPRVATRPAAYRIPLLLPGEIEIKIADATNTRRLVAVIEFVSPSNKKEAGERDAFATKCKAYLESGIGLVVVDIVTNRHANLHNELMTRMGLGAPYLFPQPTPIYTASYQPVRTDGANGADVWPTVLEIGRPLPAVVLPLTGAGTIDLDLEGTYTTALEQSGI
jgi:hypothetical protein